MPRFGRIKQHAITYVFVALIVSLSACVYGFSGGGLPSHVKSIAVVPFENETAIADLQREIADTLRTRLTSRLGIRSAAVANANAVVQGAIKQYQADVPVGYTAGTQAPTTARRLLQILVDVQVIDRVTGKTLWERRDFVVEGQYEEQDEVDGRARAIDRLVSAIVEGVQSQW